MVRAGAATAKSARRQPLILVVDDAEDARDMYSTYFEHVGLRVETATNGVEAVEKASALTPDVIVMDLMMPVLDGWEATRRIKADRRTEKIPVVALTGHGMLSAPEKALRAGCDQFVMKPCLPQKLHQIISPLLTRKP